MSSWESVVLDGMAAMGWSADRRLRLLAGGHRPTPAVRSSRLQAAKRSLAMVLGESWLPASPSDWSPVTRPCRIGIGQCAAPDDAHIRKGGFKSEAQRLVNELK